MQADGNDPPLSQTVGGQLVQEAPTVYQLGAGGARQPVSGGYVVNPDGLVGFQVRPHDHGRSLYPVLDYSSYLGGSGTDQGNAIALNAAGNAFVTGQTISTNFPTTTGAYQTSNAGGTDAFVTEMNTGGTGLVYSTYLGGSGNDEGYGIALDGQGRAVVAGATASTNFPTLNPVQASNGGGNDAFLARLSATGAALS